MNTLALATAVLLVCCTAACDTEQGDSIVLTTADRLRQEIKKEMKGVCSCKDIATELQKHANGITSALSKTFKDLLEQHSRLITPGLKSSNPAYSCKEILQLAPRSPSGLYWIRGTDNKPKRMYCDMKRTCKGIAGGWMRVASIDMTDSSSRCPSALKTITSPRRLCAKGIDGPGCSSVVFPVQGVEYSQVCGKIIGYQEKTPDAFISFINGKNTLDSNYVDGISMTHGKNPRKHIWTFAAAVHEYNSAKQFVCPCTNTRNRPPPPVPKFIGNDYFCDTGSTNHFRHIFYGKDPLWDGKGCGQFSTCCSFNSPPWFRKEVSPTKDDIEIRLCTDQPRRDEDINFETLEIYVQ